MLTTSQPTTPGLVLENKLIALVKNLIQRPSVTPEDLGCQALISTYLTPLGFSAEDYSHHDVTNTLWCRGNDPDKPTFAFIGHTDVVPPGPLDAWQYPPFSATTDQGYLYGRGAADMKGNIAAFIMAVELFLHQTPDPNYNLMVMLTSDEEGPSIHGVKHMMAALKTQQRSIQYGLVGEASSDQSLADTLKIGSRGSLNGKLVIEGKQGHVGFHHLALNAVHVATNALTKLQNQTWDTKDSPYFEATSLQITNIQAGTGAVNVIPGTIEILFNFRHGPNTSQEALIQHTERILNQHTHQYTLEWTRSAQAYCSEPGALTQACRRAITQVTDQEPRLTTQGGTCDGRFLAPLETEIIELGVCNHTIHQVNECVKITDLIQLTHIYHAILDQLSNDLCR